MLIGTIWNWQGLTWLLLIPCANLIWSGEGMALTYLAVCLLSIDRPVRLCAANLWGELVEKT